MRAGTPAREEGRSRPPSRLSLSRTLTLGLALLLMASLGSSLWVAIGVAQRNTFELQRSLAELTVKAVSDEVQSYMAQAQDQVRFLTELVENGEVAPDDETRLTDLLWGALAAAPQVSGIAFVRNDYSVVRAGYRDGRLLVVSEDWSGRPEIRQAMANSELYDDPHWRGVDWIADFAEPHILVAGTVRRQGELLGIIFSVVSIRKISAFLADYDQGNKETSFILRGHDEVLAHPDMAKGFQGLSPQKLLPKLGDLGEPALAAFWDPPIDEMPYLLADGSPIQGHIVSGEDSDYVYFYRTLEIHGEEPWTIGVYFRTEDVNLPFKRLYAAGAFGIAIMVVAVVAGLLVARSIVRPLRRLASASQQVSRLDIGHVEPLKRSPFRELDATARAFNAMLGGLRWFETYVPRSLVLRLMASGGSSVESEERQVTVLFTDIVGFTNIGSSLQPEALARLLNEHFKELAEAIDKEEGTVDKYIGDSIMAFWGAPLDQPDHAVRACRAALEIAARLQQENRERRAAGLEPIRLRIGIHSGAAVVGNIGAPGRVNYTLIGDTVNSAQRLEALGKEVAPEAEVIVLIGDTTRLAVCALCRTVAVGRFVLRGRDCETEVYRLVVCDEPRG